MYVITFTFPFMPDDQLYKKIGTRRLTKHSDVADSFYTYSGAMFQQLIYKTSFLRLPKRFKPVVKIVRI